MGEGALILLASAAGGLAAVAAREAVLATPALARWLRAAVDPLRRAGREGYEPSGDERRRLAVVGTVALVAAGTIAAGPVPALALGVAGPATAAWAVAARRARYRSAVERAMPEAARAIADALAGGRSVRGALAAAAGSVEGAAGIELSRLAADLGSGSATAEALAAFRARIGSPRVDALATALISQQLAGGDLGTLLRRFALAAADQDRAAEDARAATAQARFTGLLVVALPGGAALFAELLAPGFAVRVLSHPGAIAMLALAGALQLGGFALIRRLGRAGA